MGFEDLTPEQLEKFKACTSVEEAVELIQEEGLELSDEALESIAGGFDWFDLLSGVDTVAFVKYCQSTPGLDIL